MGKARIKAVQFDQQAAPMNTEAALLNAILHEPGDDTARLVYADYLQENGQGERAEFIRAHVAYHHVANALAEVDDPGERASRGWQKHWRLFCAGLPGHAFVWAGWFEVSALLKVRYGRPVPVYYHFDRGLPAELELPLAAYLRHRPALFRAAPFVSVRLTDRVANDVGPGYAWCGAAGDLWRRSADSMPFEMFEQFWRSCLLAPDQEAVWDSRDAADDALSRLCVAWGRQAVPPRLE